MRKIYICLMVVFVIACGKTSYNITSFEGNYNITNGLLCFSESGVYKGTIGAPSQDIEESNWEPGWEEVRLLSYPNPSMHSFYSKFMLSESKKVKVWVENSYPSEYLNRLTNFRYDKEEKTRVVVKTLVDNELFAGSHLISWSGHDEHGNQVPAGFYRIYVEIEDKLYTNDVLYGDQSLSEFDF